MAAILRRLKVSTAHPVEIIDITDHVRDWVRQSGVRDGLLTVMSPHTTARITLNEREAELQSDMVQFLTSLVPHDGLYGHNRAPVDDRLNAHSHLLGLFINASESIPVVAGDVLIGSWQSIFLVELDGPRAEREVVLHLLSSA